MKSFSVQYNTTVSYDTVVKAKNAEEAKKKVIEVIGEPIQIESVYEVNKRA
jgi:hypothetical protein